MNVRVGVKILETRNQAPWMACEVEIKMASLREVHL